MAEDTQSIFEKAELAIMLLHANGTIPLLQAKHIVAIADATMKVALEDYLMSENADMLRLHREKMDAVDKCVSMEIAMRNMIALAKPYFTDETQLLAISEAEKAMAMTRGWRATD